MSQRLWAQLEDQFGILIHGKPKELVVSEQPPDVPDRTENQDVSSENYDYESLDICTSSIRLLELFPGARQDDIACRLFECRLNEQHGAYEALSYVWGDTQELTPIRVNDKTLKIGKNLRTALLNIRKVDEPRIIWVDGICINQAEVQERNHQVSYMDEIYRNAVRTIVWLDEGNKYTEKAYKMLEELATVAHTRRDSGLDSAAAQQPAFLNDITLSLLDMKLLESPLFDKYRDDSSILHLAYAEWWVRSWTIQEILLASQALIVVGKFAIDWERFCTAIDYGLAIGIWSPVNLGLIINPVVVPYISMHSLRLRRKSSRLSSPSTSTSSELARSLLELLIYCRFRDARDPRDKIHCLLGLVPGSQSNGNGKNIIGIEPDYSLSAEELFRHAARRLILQSGNLDVLGACLSRTNLTLPSWVPDWTIREHAPRPMMHDAMGLPRLTRATPLNEDAHLSHRFDGDGNALVLSGHEVTTVAAVAPVLDRLISDVVKFEPLTLGESLASRLALLPTVLSRLGSVYSMLACVVPHLGIFSDWEVFAREDSPSNPQPLPPSPGDDSDPLAIYWQTLSAGALAPEGRAATARLFYAWRANLKPISRLHRWQIDRVSRPLAFVGYLNCTWQRYSEFAQFLEIAYERRLGRGENGYLALLPAGTEMGDRIILAKGGRVPLVVRPRKTKGEYTFVGEAYVHGIMDGEGFYEGKCKDIRIV